jgi:O-antigen ligase
LIVGGTIGLHYDLKEITTLLSGFGVLILAASAFLIIFNSNIGVMNYHSIQGAWRGLFWHKNHFGLIAAFINLLFLINLIDSIRSGNKQKYVWGLLYLLSFLFIFKSDSAAAYITTICLTAVVLIAFLWLRFKTKLRRVHYWIFFSALILLLAIAFLGRNFIFGTFNRDASLTGRVPMWSYLFKTYMEKRPLLGYGFNAFWYDNFHRVNIQAVAGYPDPIVISDNGFIDILVNTGVIGFLLFLVFYFGMWWRSVKTAKEAVNLYGLFPLFLMCFTLIANISWSLLFENENFFMLAMVAVLFCNSRKGKRKQGDLSLKAAN